MQIAGPIAADSRPSSPTVGGPPNQTLVAHRDSLQWIDKSHVIQMSWRLDDATIRGQRRYRLSARQTDRRRRFRPQSRWRGRICPRLQPGRFTNPWMIWRSDL